MTDLGVWQAEATSVDAVLDALAGLRRSSELGATRTLVMTLVIVGHDRAELARALDGIHQLGSKHPARTLLIHLLPDADPALDAVVDLQGAGDDDGRRVVFEDVHLQVRGPAARHLDSFIEPFTLPDLPVVVWFVDQLPSAADPVLSAADVVVVDSRDFGGLDCFSTVAMIAEARPVIDLSWVRLQPWRSALRGLFDGAGLRPFAAGVRGATVEGKTGPRHLIAGWLAGRLDLALADVRLAEGDHLSFSVRARLEGRHARAAVRRLPDRRALVADAHVEGAAAISTTLLLPRSGPAWGLAEGLSRLVRDPVFESSLRTALDF